MSLSAVALAVAGIGGPAQADAAGAVSVDAVVRQYAVLVQAGYADAIAGARKLQGSILKFTAAPTEAGLKQARADWLAAREVYGQTEAFRFYGGPIDGDEGPEGQINAWPMDEAYVDGVDGQPGSGMINDARFEISKEKLVEMNERGGEENVATGWHAIEFLLWGQDLFDDGPGRRSYEDFVDGRGRNADRRRLYLETVTGLLIDDLEGVARAWAPGVKDNYRAAFEVEGLEAVRKILVGIGSLSRGELAGERLEVALNSQDQEDEHSCFSDNTHRDAVTNALGIENVWLGRYRRPDGSVLEGASLRALVAAKDAALAERTSRQIRNSVERAEAIQAPFDQEIVGGADAPGRKRVQATIDSLIQQSQDIVASAQAVGITRLTLTQP